MLQVVTELPLALNLAYPPMFAGFAGAGNVLVLDFFAILKLDCIGNLSVHGKFVGIMASPLVSVAVFRLIQSIADRRAARNAPTRDEALAESHNAFAYRCFVVLWMLYPLLSKTALRMFICQSLSLDERWHIDDLNVDVSVCTLRSLNSLVLRTNK